jgi:hypothetical protein
MKIPALLAILMSGAFLAACDPAGADDGALVGSWLRTRDTGEMRDRWVFRAEGSFTFDENKPDDPAAEDHVTGSYSTADGIVTATANNTLAPGQTRVTFSYYAGPTQFASAALLPRDARTGIVGVWAGIVRIEQLGDTGAGQEGSEGEYDFRADGTFHATVTSFEDNTTKTADGTWTTDGADRFVLTSSTASGGSTPHVFRMLDGAALADDGRVWLRN